MIPDEIKAEILARTDIVKLIGEHVDLRKAGANFKACCPFHGEKTPSFQVYPVDGSYHCFGCQAHGDAIRFLMDHGGRTFIEAMRELASRVGVEIPESRPVPPALQAAQKAKKDLAGRLLEVQDKICAWYSRALAGPEGAGARAYLSDRGIKRETAEAFRLGWAEGDAEALAAFVTEAEIDPADLILLGILVSPDAEGERPNRGGPFGGARLRFYRRLMCPVVDLRGEVTGFSGRIIESRTKAPKYLNSPETPVFKKGEQLYGAHTARLAARKAGRLVLCEGNLDVVTLWQAGFQGTVAPMGTALTPAQVRLAKRLSEQVVCVMDGDAAGQKAAFNSLVPFLETGVQPRAVLMPAGEDPDSFVRKEGAAAFGLKLDAAPPLFDLVIEHTAANHPPDPPGRLAAVRALSPALIALDDPLAKALYRARIAERLALPLDLVDAARDEVQAQQAAERRKAEQRAQPAPTPRAEPPRSEAAPPPAPEPRDVPWDSAPPPWLAPEDVPPEDLHRLRDAPPAGDGAWIQRPGPSATPRPQAPEGIARVEGAPAGVPPATVAPTDVPAWLEPTRRPPAASPQTETGQPGVTGLAGSSTGSTRGGNPAAEPASKRPVRVSRFEEEALEFILVFPDLALRLRHADAHDSLTDGRVAAFVASLCDELEAGRTPDADHLLARQTDPEVVAFLRALQGRRSPTIDELNRLTAFDGAVRRIRVGALKKTRTALFERIKHAAPEELNALRAAYDDVQRMLRDLQKPTGEGAG